MSGKMIAVANMKGGVGKTTAVVCLAEALAAYDLNKKVLVVDIDPQASASICLAGEDLLFDLITKKKTLQDLLKLRIVDHKSTPNIKHFIRGHISFTTH